MMTDYKKTPGESPAPLFFFMLIRLFSPYGAPGAIFPFSAVIGFHLDRLRGRKVLLWSFGN